MRTTALIAILLSVSSAFAADAKKADERFVNIFDGKTLDGWKAEFCEAARPRTGPCC